MRRGAQVGPVGALVDTAAVQVDSGLAHANRGGSLVGPGDVEIHVRGARVEPEHHNRML